MYTVKPDNYELVREMHKHTGSNKINIDITVQSHEQQSFINCNYQNMTSDIDNLELKYCHIQNLYSYGIEYFHYTVNEDLGFILKKNLKQIVRNLLSTTFDLNCYVDIESYEIIVLDNVKTFSVFAEVKSSPFEINAMCLYNLAHELLVQRNIDPVIIDSFKGMSDFTVFHDIMQILNCLPNEIYVNVRGEGHQDNHCCSYRSDYIKVEKKDFKKLFGIQFYKPDRMEPLPEYMTINQLFEAINKCFMESRGTDYRGRPNPVSATAIRCCEYVKFAVGRAKHLRVKHSHVNQPGLKKKQQWQKYVDHFMPVKVVQILEDKGSTKWLSIGSEDYKIRQYVEVPKHQVKVQRMVKKVEVKNYFEPLETEYYEDVVIPGKENVEIIEHKIAGWQPYGWYDRDTCRTAILEAGYTRKVNIRKEREISFSSRWTIKQTREYRKSGGKTFYPPWRVRKESYLEMYNVRKFNKERFPKTIKQKIVTKEPERIEKVAHIKDKLVEHKKEIVSYEIEDYLTDSDAVKYENIDKLRKLRNMPVNCTGLTQRIKHVSRPKKVDMQISLEDFLIARANSYARKHIRYSPKDLLITKENFWQALEQPYIVKGALGLVKSKRKNCIDIIKIMVGIK